MPENYFNYFSEIEQHFQKRRGTQLILSPLDWALMETWKDAGIPVEAVLRGIDSTFDKWERRPSRTRKVNGLAFCAQEVLASAEEMKEAAIGAAPVKRTAPRLETERVTGFLTQNAAHLRTANLPITARAIAEECAATLLSLAAWFADSTRANEDLERRLTVMEEKLFGALLAATPDAVLLKVRVEADHDLAPYRSKMTAPQIEQLQKQYVHKRVLEQYAVPRLSLFYMP